MAENGAGCCPDNPSAMAYPPKSKGSEDCLLVLVSGSRRESTFSETVGDNFHSRMIDNSVVGFIDPAFSGPEQGPGHSVPVGYMKGGTIAGQNLVFDVGNTPGTASEFIIYSKNSEN